MSQMVLFLIGWFLGTLSMFVYGLPEKLRKDENDMDVRDYLTASKYINDCPNCGSDDIREGKGTLGVSNSIIERTCECGFNFKYDVDAGVKPRQIKQAIDEALSEC